MLEMVTGNAQGAERGEQLWVAQSVWHHHVGAHTVPCSVLYPRARSQGYRDGLGVSGAVSGALPLPPGTRWAPCDPPACPPGSPAAWHKPGQLHIPGARFSSAGGIRGSSRGLSPPGSLRRARLGTTAAGTCSRRYRERGENTTAMLPRSSCCRWDVGAVSPRVPARLSLDASSVFAEPSPSSFSGSSRRCRPPVPGGSWGRNDSTVPSSGNPAAITSVIQPGLASWDGLGFSRRLWEKAGPGCGVAHVSPTRVPPGAPSRGSSDEQPS